MSWHFRGVPPVLLAQGNRIGISPILVDRARHNAEIHRISTLLGQLCDRYHKARKEDGEPVFNCHELDQIEATVFQAEQESAKLHALAAAAAVMIDEARKAFGLDDADRDYAVLSITDDVTVPTRSNGTPATTTSTTKTKH